MMTNSFHMLFISKFVFTVFC
uniref:Uncharacterized protein n=1 Tax=Rhizophora mucronata TaxID=61149 RepID=A0A2P2QC15_RHIMU